MAIQVSWCILLRNMHKILLTFLKVTIVLNALAYCRIESKNCLTIPQRQISTVRTLETWSCTKGAAPLSHPALKDPLISFDVKLKAVR